MKKYTTQIICRIPAEHKTKLERKAKRFKTRPSDIIRAMIAFYVGDKNDTGNGRF